MVVASVVVVVVVVVVTGTVGFVGLGFSFGGITGSMEGQGNYNGKRIVNANSFLFNL